MLLHKTHFVGIFSPVLGFLLSFMLFMFSFRLGKLTTYISQLSIGRILDQCPGFNCNTWRVKALEPFAESAQNQFQVFFGSVSG